MKITRRGLRVEALALGLAALAIAASPSLAVDLAAVPAQWTPPGGGTAITMWAYVADTGSCPAGPVAWTPGPELSATAGGSLTINLRNCLGEAVSMFIPGQLKATTPVWTDGSTGNRTSLTQRVRSFDAETAAGAVHTYTWTGVKEGTYLYHSGTHPAVQVEMGLYGALVVSGAGYPAADQDQVLVFSEIDPTLHAAVAAGCYGSGAPDLTCDGTSKPLWMSSTFDYHPAYFLINGAAWGGGAAPIPVTTSASVRLRFVNAGLKVRTPTLGGGLYMTLFAEDGNLYPFTTEQYSVQLAPAKTIDAMLTIPADGSYALYDRSLGLTNGAATGGGMLTYLVAGAPVGAPTAVADPDASTPAAYTIAEDSGLSTVAGGSPAGVLDNDTGGAAAAVLLSGPSSGTLVGGLAADGSFTYTPNANFNGTDSFTYVANDGLGGPNSYPATATITITPVNDAPAAANDGYQVVAGSTLSVAAPGVLGNDSDIDGDSLTVSGNTTPAIGILTMYGDGGFDFDASALAAGNVATFTYTANDGAADSNSATVTITVIAPVNQAPVAVDDSASTPKNTAVVISVLANDSDADGTLAVGSVDLNPALAGQQTSVVCSRGGSASLNILTGAVTYTPPTAGFRGTDTFTYTVNDNLGATSNVATVRVNVTK